MIIYHAAADTKFTCYKAILPKDYNLFMSYYYRRSADKLLEISKPQGHTGLITIDSGAHSFFETAGIGCTGGKTKGTKKQRQPKEFLADYLKWVKANYELFDYFVELDIQDLVGIKQVREWRNMFREEGLADKMIMVHHSSDPEEHYDELLETSQSRYVGLEGTRDGQLKLNHKACLKKAYDLGIRVHGFAFTRTELLYDIPFYSVDSSSWSSSVRFGVFQMFVDGKMKGVAPIKDHFMRFAPPLFMHNHDRSLTRGKQQLEWAAVEYRKLETFFTEVWNYKGVNWEKQLQEYEYNITT